MADRGAIPIVAVLLAAALARAGEEPAEVVDYAPYPAPDVGYVTDLADLLSQDQEARIEGWLAEAKDKTGVEIVVVTIGSVRDYPGTANQSIEAFATGLFNAYEIGRLPQNDGVLLLVARRDRKVRIEWGAGYGNMPVGEARKIRDEEIIPRFKRDDYAGGIIHGVKALMREFADVRVGFNWTLIILIGLAALGALVTVDLFRSGKRGWGWVAAGAVIIFVLLIFQIIALLARSRGRAWGGTGGSVGGFGGGFSGGGGFSAGGGVTGSW